MTSTYTNGRVTTPPQLKTVKIGSRLVGEGQPCFILAEAGVNHNGDPDLARRLVRIAAECGADAVKFQKRTNADILTREALDAPYVKANSFGPTYGAHREHLELSQEVWESLRDLAAEVGIEFTASAWDKRSADFLEALDVPAYKTASADLTNLDLLAHIARKGRPMIVSSGMAGIEEVDAAVNAILRHNDQLVLLQCTSTYPSEFADINLRVMQTYRERYGVLVGYSGHERGIAVSEAAATLGACLIERHFTVDRTLPGPDHAASLEPVGLQKLVRDIRNIELALGTTEKRMVPAEAPVRARLAKSVVAARPISAGTVIDRGMLTLKGPGDGIPASAIDDLVGRVAAEPIAEDTLLPTTALGWHRGGA